MIRSVIYQSIFPEHFSKHLFCERKLDILRDTVEDVYSNAIGWCTINDYEFVAVDNIGRYLLVIYNDGE